MRPPHVTMLAPAMPWVLLCILQFTAVGAPPGAPGAPRLKALIPLYDGDQDNLRIQWDPDNGFCGETSIQAVAAYHGAWVSQNISRELAGGEVLVGDGENMEMLVAKLGFNYTKWEERLAQLPAYQRTLENYMVWMKQQIIAGLVVIFGARLRGGTDEYYDHIMPAFGIEYTSPNTYSPTDRLIWTDNYGDYISRPLGRTNAANGPPPASSFYTHNRQCRRNEVQGGCIPKSLKHVTGLAMGGLLDAYGILKPVRLLITGWADEAQYGYNDEYDIPYNYYEPTNAKAVDMETCPCGAHIMGSFQLDMSNSGVKFGENFTIFRCDGPGSVPTNPRSIEDMRAASKCKAYPFVMGASVSNQLSHVTFGDIDSLSVVYFVCVIGH